MPVAAVTTITIWHASEYFYPAIDMFNDNTPSGKPFVISLFLFGQLMFFTWFYRNKTVWMIILYSKISKISVKRNGVTDWFPYGIFENFKIMFTAFCLLHINDLPTITFYDNLSFYCVVFFCLNNTLFGSFLAVLIKIWSAS